MGTSAKIVVLVLLLTLLGVVVTVQRGGGGRTREAAPVDQSMPLPAEPWPVTAATPQRADDEAPLNPISAAGAIEGRPHLLQLTASDCTPCRLMAPILEELAAEYIGSLRVTAVDVDLSPFLADAYQVETTPTQIFLAPDARILYRHEGILDKEDILAKWAELGFRLRPALAASEGAAGPTIARPPADTTPPPPAEGRPAPPKPPGGPAVEAR